ncbi:hypothetical protein G17_00091 [Escherichia phage vB_EcoM_G17]|nr:AAA family ATPase [Escherichia coli]NES47672.1 AAA family ATPase [Escherichia coli]QBO61587.1 hypothetical protein G17_00091 [Escherichia phage vB_EcoM_G17]WNN14416.1 hypothetical protein Sharanji_gp128 [Escherichia phage Sharanji]HAN4490940.1 AAA family ATPase [Escherichia coli]
MTREARSIQIQKNFNSMMVALECLLDDSSTVKSMVVSGAPGVGKTYTLSQRLQKAHDAAEWNVATISGKMTTLALYEVLYKNRHSTNVLVLDDMDSIFDSEDGMNLLKAVLDSGKRTVSYMTSSKYLSTNGIPNSFDFNGRIVFITNKDLALDAKAKTKMSAHYAALMSRSVYVDLQIQTKSDIMIHIENVMTKTNILASKGVNSNGSKAILNWMLKHEDSLRSPSLRMPLLISAVYNNNPYDWEEQCENLFLEKI